MALIWVDQSLWDLSWWCCAKTLRDELKNIFSKWQQGFISFALQNFTLLKCVQEYPPVLSHPSPCFYTCLYFCISVCHSISPSLSQERWAMDAKSYCYYFWTWTLQLNESSRFNQIHTVSGLKDFQTHFGTLDERLVQGHHNNRGTESLFTILWLYITFHTAHSDRLCFSSNSTPVDLQ